MTYPPGPPTTGTHWPSPHPAPMNGYGVTALVLGIVGLALSFVPLIGIVAWPLVILGIIFGAVGRGRVTRRLASNGGQATAGLVLSILGLVVCLLWLIAAMSAAPRPRPTGPDFGGLTPAQWSKVTDCTDRGTLTEAQCRRIYGP
jgi:hypothetical protein